jgi:hypothetical protein
MGHTVCPSVCALTVNTALQSEDAAVLEGSKTLNAQKQSCYVLIFTRLHRVQGGRKTVDGGDKRTDGAIMMRTCCSFERGDIKAGAFLKRH